MIDEEEVVSEINDDTEEINANIEKIEPGGFIKKDELVTNIINRGNEIAAAKKKDKDERLAKQIKKEEQQRRKKKIKRLWLPFYMFFKFIFSIKTYIRFIQKFEEPLFVLFVDSLVLGNLFAIGYIIYIALVSDNNSNIYMMCFKLVCCMMLSGICLLSQKNIPTMNLKNNEDMEDE